MSVQDMGNYQEHLKKQPHALREIETQPARQHTFGNPFKVNKVRGQPRVHTQGISHSWYLLFHSVCIKVEQRECKLNGPANNKFSSVRVRIQNLMIDETDEAMAGMSPSRKRSSNADTPPASPKPNKRKPG